MIVAEPKSLEEINQMIDGYDKVLMVGCGTCTTVSLSGGEREVNLMATAVRLSRKVEGRDIEIGQQTIIRQCDWEYIDELKDVDDYQAIVSFACGAGIQGLARKFTDIPVFPGGVCPVARCAKGLLNGPCGGTNNGKCEINKDQDCAWVLIYNQLEGQGKLDKFKEILAPKDYSKAGNIRVLDLRT
jgi:hypothetical protein